MKTTSQIKREFFQKKGTATSQTPMNDAERTYNTSQSLQTQPLKQSRLDWLKELILAHGGTVTSHYFNDLLTQAVVVLGGTPSKSTSDNLKFVYQNA